MPKVRGLEYDAPGKQRLCCDLVNRIGNAIEKSGERDEVFATSKQARGAFA